jgi:hypothetical protein
MRTVFHPDIYGFEAAGLPGQGYQIACIGTTAGAIAPRLGHPKLRVRYLGYLNSAHKFGFSLDAYPGLIDEASWATWDSPGTLWARPGLDEQYTLEDFRRGAPSFTLDVDRFEPPVKAGTA